MARRPNPNLEILMLAVDQLDELANKMVFLGGCATGLLITDPAAPPIRVTRDVDAIVQVVSRGEYYQLADKLRAVGFKEDTSDDAPLCRWLTENVILDVMPTDSSILGFGNKWYASAMKSSEKIPLPNGKTIGVVSAPYFLITKLEAFDGRGNGDYLMSHDIEDIVAVLDGRPEMLNEVRQSDPALVKELSNRFRSLRKDDRFLDALPGHMPTSETTHRRVSMLLNTIEEISELR
jgi:predicted nucleotidyltransferase